jgi:hypothetical protein
LLSVGIVELLLLLQALTISTALLLHRNGWHSNSDDAFRDMRC